MKFIITIIIGLLTNLTGFSQSAKDKIILKKFNDGEIYITHDTSIREYFWLIPKSPKDDNLDFYNQYYSQIIKDTNITVFHTKSLKIPNKWTPLYMIDDEFYLYGPSDWMANYGYIFCDTTIIRQFSDGPDVNIIINGKIISANEFQFNVLTYNRSAAIITISIIDKRNDIAIWKFESDKNIHYELMVNSNYVKRFPIINCDCGDTKCFMEYEFKPIDFEELNKRVR